MQFKLFLVVIAVAGFNAPVAAQYKADRVCWADTVSRCPGVYARPDAFYECGTGGTTGFNANLVCREACGEPEGNKCKIVAGPSGSGGRCGHRTATVQCFW